MMTMIVNGVVIYQPRKRKVSQGREAINKKEEVTPDCISGTGLSSQKGGQGMTLHFGNLGDPLTITWDGTIVAKITKDGEWRCYDKEAVVKALEGAKYNLKTLGEFLKSAQKEQL